ncbi:MAG TPA: hypothetical protein VGE59_04050 [Patescibacteria group bacterium]
MERKCWIVKYQPDMRAFIARVVESHTGLTPVTVDDSWELTHQDPQECQGVILDSYQQNRYVADLILETLRILLRDRFLEIPIILTSTVDTDRQINETIMLQSERKVQIHFIKLNSPSWREGLQRILEPPTGE